MPVSDDRIASAAKTAGFTGLNLVIAVAVALGESDGNPSDIANERDGSHSYGLWQINSSHPDVLNSGDWRNPDDNARMAFRVWTEAGSKWTPWGAYNNQRYLLYLERAKKAVPDATAQDLQSLVPNTQLVNVPGVSSAQSVIEFFKFVSNPHNWFRVGLILLGMLLLGIAAIQLLAQSKMVTGQLKSAVNVAKVAAL
jgi:hypothetical protein